MTDAIKSSLWKYSDANTLVIGDIAVTGDNAKTKIAFKTCILFETCWIEISHIFVDKADCIYIAMYMYNLIEYSDNFSDTSRGFWEFKSGWKKW